MVTVRSLKPKTDYLALPRGGYEGPLIHKANVMAGDCPLAPGFYLFSGPTGSGKSTYSLALALMIAARSGLAVSYRYMLEPRAQTKDLEKLLGPNSADAIKALLEGVVAESLKYVVLDSVTYLLPALGKKMMGDQEDVTMKAGLRRSDILGVLAMDNLCRGYALTVIGTINSELFPRTADLEGACEGAITINAVKPGLIIRDRLARMKQHLALPDAAVDAARNLLGYTSSDRTATKPTSLSQVAI
jgi:energy-coupling factor transporter ATP-binding protein EcfA2